MLFITMGKTLSCRLEVSGKERLTVPNSGKYELGNIQKIDEKS